MKLAVVPARQRICQKSVAITALLKLTAKSSMYARMRDRDILVLPNYVNSLDILLELL